MVDIAQVCALCCLLHKVRPQTPPDSTDAPRDQ